MTLAPTPLTCVVCGETSTDVFTPPGAKLPMCAAHQELARQSLDTLLQGLLGVGATPEHIRKGYAFTKQAVATGKELVRTFKLVRAQAKAEAIRDAR